MHTIGIPRERKSIVDSENNTVASEFISARAHPGPLFPGSIHSYIFKVGWILTIKMNDLICAIETNKRKGKTQNDRLDS